MQPLRQRGNVPVSGIGEAGTITAFDSRNIV